MGIFAHFFVEKHLFGCFFVACFKLSPHLALIHPAGTGI
ncbi:hypothetical protein LTSEGIV_3448 [Salmonella enterica subsp. enterica serovar Give str. S5-487]|nr:hypothetical protein LTSEGIV_3448 [Salmonella enterica subsp. enterica serovar Give str. S5-487]